MNKYFNNNILIDLKKHAEGQAPNEMCGFIVDDNFIPYTNKADEPEANFKLSGKDFIDASMRGEIKCVVHSHNNCDWVSKADQIEQQKHKIPFGVVFLKNNKYSNIIFWGDQLLVQDLIGRPFIHGVYDCYGLVRDYYRTKCGVNMLEHFREMDWWDHKKDDKGNIIEPAENVLIDGIKKEDAYEVSLNDIKEHDLIFFKIKGHFCNHTAVYLGKDLILHHMFDRLSNREPIGRYRRFITNIFRLRGVK